MSLDVWLKGPADTVECICNCGHEHTKVEREVLFQANYTHNVIEMAEEAGIYDCVWRPDEHGLEIAAHIIGPLRKGIALMKADPERFKKLDPPNKWGSYDTFLPWLESYLAACEEWPAATVETCR